jgi:hypothetical protein
MRISNSFSEGEIQVLEFIVQTLLRGGSPTMATRHKEFASLCRKVMAMKAKVQEKNEKKGSTPPKNGSVDAETVTDVSEPEPSEPSEASEASEAQEMRPEQPPAEFIQLG